MSTVTGRWSFEEALNDASVDTFLWVCGGSRRGSVVEITEGCIIKSADVDYTPE